MYYHGSPYYIINQIQPMANELVDNEFVVFASNDNLLAVLFSINWTDDDFILGNANGTYFMMEQYDGALDILKTSGYLYTIDGDFQHDSRLGLKNIEFVSKKPANIIDTTKITNVYDYIIKSHNIKLIPKPNKKHMLFFKNLHNINLFKMIMDGRKTVEGRKNSLNYQQIGIGDLMMLRYKDMILTCLVVNIRKYDNVLNYLEAELKDALPCISDMKTGLRIYNTFVNDIEIYELNKKFGKGFIAFEIMFLYADIIGTHKY